MRYRRRLIAHTGIFAKLLPLAHAHNARVVLVNRRDYPGATPYTEDEFAVLKEASELLKSDCAPAAREKLAPFMRARAREVYDLLERFVAEHDVPPAQPEKNTGGIVVVGWSFASAWMMALLAHVAEFGVNDVELDKFVRRVIFHGKRRPRLLITFRELMSVHREDGPFHALGYPPPEDPYNPLWDPALGTDGSHVFVNWVSGYFQHGETADEIERRTPLKSPPPTLSTLTDEERASALYPGPGSPGQSDDLLLASGMQSGVFTELKIKALYLHPGKAEEADEADREVVNAWRDVEVRYIWCDRSVWEMTWTSWKMREEIQEAKASKKPMRNLQIVRLTGSNHFVSCLKSVTWCSVF